MEGANNLEGEQYHEKTPAHQPLGLRSLCYDRAHFSKAFHVFANVSNAFPLCLDWTSRVFSQAVVEKLSGRLATGEAVRMLGVGSGSGEMDLEMAKRIKSRFRKVHNTVLEPSSDLQSKYRYLLTQTTDIDVGGIEFDFRQQTIEQYRNEDINTHKKYHFISVVHVLYYVDDYDDILGYLYDCLEKGGILLVIVVAETSGCDRMWDRYPQLQDNLYRYVTTRSVRESYDQRSIKHEIYRQQSHVDLTQCFADVDQQSEVGDLIIDFVVQFINFRKSVPEEFYQEFMAFLRSTECRVRSADGQILWNNDWEAVVAQRE